MTDDWAQDVSADTFRFSAQASSHCAHGASSANQEAKFAEIGKAHEKKPVTRETIATMHRAPKDCRHILIE
jgi:hypothetical protein